MRDDLKRSDGHVLEAAKSRANQWMKALDLCNSRILGEGPDGPFDARPARLEVEIHFFLVALLRFYRSISLAASKLQRSETLDDRIRDFHAYIGIKRTMRNVGEHFDEYLLGSGRDRTIDTRGLQVWEMDLQGDNVRFTWLGETFDLKRTMREACELWAIFLNAYHMSLPRNSERG